jgi:hypothetical protein
MHHGNKISLLPVFICFLTWLIMYLENIFKFIFIFWGLLSRKINIFLIYFFKYRYYFRPQAQPEGLNIRAKLNVK